MHVLEIKCRLLSLIQVSPIMTYIYLFRRCVRAYVRGWMYALASACVCLCVLVKTRVFSSSRNCNRFAKLRLICLSKIMKTIPPSELTKTIPTCNPNLNSVCKLVCRLALLTETFLFKWQRLRHTKALSKRPDFTQAFYTF